MLVHIFHHIVAHRVIVLPLGCCFRIRSGDFAILVIFIISCRNILAIFIFGIGLGLPGFIKQLGDQLLFVLRLGDGVHLVLGLGLGGPGQFQLQLGEHQLQARGGAQFTERNRGRAIEIDFAHV